jgi:hypothetical protein
MATQIFSDNGRLTWDRSYPKASREEYLLAERCLGSIFEVLYEGEEVELEEGVFILAGENLDLVESGSPIAG